MIRTFARTLRHAPAYAALVIGTVALATGISAAVYSTVAAVQRPESPFKRPESLFVVHSVGDGAHGTLRPYDNLIRLSQSSTPLRELWFVDWSRALVVSPTKAREHGVVRVEPMFFQQFSKRPLAGRFLSSADTLPGQPLTALISASFWRSEFDGNDIEGKFVSVDGTSYAVVGVTPDDTDALMQVAVWLPASRRELEQSADTRATAAIVLARRDADRVTLEASLRKVSQQLQEEYGSGRWAFRFLVRESVPASLPLSELHRALIAAILALILIATANLASLAHTRVARRGPSLAVRRALGASRMRVLRDVLVESAGLATIGGAIGALVFVSAIGFLKRIIPVHAPLIGDLRLQLDWSLIAFAFVLALLVAMSFAIGPAIRAAAVQPDRLLRSASIASTHGLRPLQAGLVILQISIALALLNASVLVERGARRASLTAESSQLNGLVEISMTLASRAEGAPETPASETLGNVEEAFRKAAPAQASTWWAWPRNSGLSLEGTSGAGDRRTLYGPDVRAVSWDYLAVTRIPIVRGRDFAPGDDDGPMLAIVDERTAAELWPHESPLGRQVSTVRGKEREWATVIGVARSPRSNLSTFDAFLPSRPSTYLTGKASANERNRVFVARLESHDDGRALAALESRVRDALPPDARSWVSVPADAAEQVRNAYAFIALLFKFFSGVAVALAALGLYADLATTAQASSRDRGIRLALGARPGVLAATIARQGVTLLLAGTAIGAFLAMATTSFVDPFIYDLYRIDALSLAAAEALLLLAGLLAVWPSARKAYQTSAEGIARSA